MTVGSDRSAGSGVQRPSLHSTSLHFTRSLLGGAKRTELSLIGKKPASRGTVESAAILVARLSERRSTVVLGFNAHSGRRRPTKGGPPRPVIAPYPFPSASTLLGVGRHRVSTRVRQFSPP